MADEVKTEEEETSTFGAFDNKYVRGGIAAVIAAYAAKEDPYLLQGFQEKMDELEKADRARRDKFIETATASATKEITRNRLKRLERRQAAEPEIKRAVALGMNPYFAGRAYETGNLKTLLKEKAANPNLPLNELYQVGAEYKDAIPGFSTDDILEALAGPTVKLKGLLDDIKAPKRRSFLTNFIRGSDEDTSAKAEIDKNIQAQQPTQDSTTKPVDFSGVSLSDRGRQFLESAGKAKSMTYGQSKTELASYVASTMGLKGIGGKSPISIGPGEFMFQSDSVANNKIADDITAKLLTEVDRLVNDVNSVAYNDRRRAVDIVRAKYQKSTDKGFTIDIEAINKDEDREIIPQGWTPTTPTKEEIDTVKKNTNIDNIVAEYEAVKESLKNDRSLTTRERNDAYALQKERFRNKIKKLMKLDPPKATQDDLAKIN